MVAQQCEGTLGMPRNSTCTNVAEVCVKSLQTFLMYVLRTQIMILFFFFLTMKGKVISWRIINVEVKEKLPPKDEIIVMDMYLRMITHQGQAT